jgi:hypothetical protein
MTQEQANRIFQTDLGQQCNEIFVTSDEEVFIRHQEAMLHTEGKLISNTFPLENKEILTFYPTNETFWDWQFLPLENLYYLFEWDIEGILSEFFLSHKNKWLIIV